MTTCVLLSCHGTVENLDDIPEFLKNIRRGRPAPPELVAEVRRRFQLIGSSPLLRITRQQAAALEERIKVPVRVAGRLWQPFPGEALSAFAREGRSTVISLPLAPHSVHVYHAAVRQRAMPFERLRVAEVPSWGLEPALLDCFVETIEEGLARFDASRRDAVAIVLSAHSLPLRVVESGDPYERDVRATANAVIAKLAPRPNPTYVAFQSQAMNSDDWLGPTLAQTFAEVARAGAREILVAPIGFLSDHIETLYDLDVEAPALAERLGFTRFERAPAANDRRLLIDALENVCRAAGL